MLAVIKGVVVAFVIFAVYSLLAGFSMLIPESPPYAGTALMFGSLVGGPLVGVIIAFRAWVTRRDPERGTPAFERRQVCATHIAGVSWLIIALITLHLLGLIG